MNDIAFIAAHGELLQYRAAALGLGQDERGIFGMGRALRHFAEHFFGGDLYRCQRCSQFMGGGGRQTT